MSVLDAPLTAAAGVVTALAGALDPVLGTAATAAAVVALTLAVRALLLPLSHAQIRGEQARARLLPLVRELRQRHRTDRPRLQREVAELYRREGTTPLAGCLPTLLQLPFVALLYRLFTAATLGGQPNLLLDASLFGVQLGTAWYQLVGAAAFATHSVFVALAALLALVVWWSVRRSTFPTAPAPAVLRLLPYGVVVAAGVLPLAAVLSLLVTITVTAVHRAVVLRPA